MIETGFSALLETATSLPVFALELPKDGVPISGSNPKAIIYRSILSKALYNLTDQDALTVWEVQIDCIGNTADDSYALAKTIKDYLAGGWRGVLSDGTLVQAVFQLPGQVDGFLADGRTFVRSLEYEIHYLER